MQKMRISDAFSHFKPIKLLDYAKSSINIRNTKLGLEREDVSWLICDLAIC